MERLMKFRRLSWVSMALVFGAIDPIIQKFVGEYLSSSTIEMVFILSTSLSLFRIIYKDRVSAIYKLWIPIVIDVVTIGIQVCFLVRGNIGYFTMSYVVSLSLSTFFHHPRNALLDHLVNINGGDQETTAAIRSVWIAAGSIVGCSASSVVRMLVGIKASLYVTMFFVSLLTVIDAFVSMEGMKYVDDCKE